MIAGLIDKFNKIVPGDLNNANNKKLCCTKKKNSFLFSFLLTVQKGDNCVSKGDVLQSSTCI